MEVSNSNAKVLFPSVSFLKKKAREYLLADIGNI